MQRLRLRYAKRGRARFSSHRDFGRAFERALRRAQIPMAYSSGYSPHPRISYANASPTGAATEAEYLEIGLAERRSPGEVRDAINAALPLGLVILEAVEADAGSLAERLTASRWHIDVAGVPRAVLDEAVAQLLASPELSVQRLTKTGMRAFDVRSAILRLDVLDDRTVELVSVHQVPLVRPDDVVQALGRVHPAFRPTPAGALHPLATGPLGRPPHHRPVHPARQLRLRPTGLVTPTTRVRWASCHIDAAGVMWNTATRSGLQPDVPPSTEVADVTGRPRR